MDSKRSVHAILHWVSAKPAYPSESMLNQPHSGMHMSVSSNWLMRIASIVLMMLTLVAPANAAGSASSLIERGMQQWAANNLDDAQASFEAAIKAEPNSIEANSKLAGLKLSRNDFKGSIAAYQQLIGLSPKNAKAWLGLGLSYMHVGNHDLSIAAFEEALRLEPVRKAQIEPILEKLRK